MALKVSDGLEATVAAARSAEISACLLDAALRSAQYFICSFSTCCVVTPACRFSLVTVTNALREGESESRGKPSEAQREC